jgi:AcrR family transcriptional regulator
MQVRDPLFSEIDSPAARRLLLAGIESFARVGYHATTTRQLAAAARMSPAALYVHYKSKTDLLEEIIRLGHQSALETFELGFSKNETPSERIAAAVRNFTVWHARNQRLARVVQYELESLPPARRREIGALRTHFESMLRSEIKRGIAEGSFYVEDIRAVATAIFSLCIDVARWFSPRSRRSAEQIGELYGELALRMIRASYTLKSPSALPAWIADTRFVGGETVETRQPTCARRPRVAE